MANSACLIQWGMPIENRELKAVEVFMASVAWGEKQKSQGKIEDFKMFGALTGNQQRRSGFTLVEGSQEQLRTLMDTEEWRELMVRVATVCHDVDIALFETGEAMADRMRRYGKVVRETAG
jgi:hypothetical protein